MADNIKYQIMQNNLIKNMLPEINSDLSSGEQIITINKDNKLAKGIYFINLSINGTKMYKKLVLN